MMLSSLRSVLIQSCLIYNVVNGVVWDYTAVQYGTEDPTMQVMNIAVPSEGNYGVMMFHHSKGSTYDSLFGQRDLNSALENGYAFVSYETVGAAIGVQVDFEFAWRSAQTCFDYLRENADVYGWDSNNIIVGGRSLGSIVGWKLFHSQHPSIVGIYTYNALPAATWNRPDVWYPPDDVVSPVPPTYMVFGPGPTNDDGHNPIHAYPVRDKYIELGEEDQLTYIEGMWDNPELYGNGRWINEYGTFHYLPDLIAQIRGDDTSSTSSPITTTPAPVSPSPIAVTTPSPTTNGPVPTTPTGNPPPSDEVETHPYEPLTRGANCLFIGHSFFVPVSRQFNTFVQMSQQQVSRLFPNHGFNTEFSGGLTGSPGRLWDDIGHRTSITESLSTGDIELFGMTSYDGDEEEGSIQAVIDAFNESGGEYPTTHMDEKLPDYTQWIDLALSYNPDTTIFLGWHWTTYNSRYTTDKFKEYNEFLCDAFYNTFVLELRTLYPDTQIIYICYGPIASTMRQMFEDGELSDDLQNLVGWKVNSVFTDADRGHAGEMMLHMMGIVWLQILYDPPPEFLNTYIQNVTPYNKTNVRTIINESLEFNAKYNIKEEEDNVFTQPDTPLPAPTTNAPTTSSPTTNAPTTMQPSQRPSITISSSPSMTPTTNSSEPAEGGGGIIGICFPSESIVQVLRQNKKINIPMEQLRIHDYVLTMREDNKLSSLLPSYEHVYSFGHYDPNLPTVEYLRFLPSGLEVSANHYVYRITNEKKKGYTSRKFVPARDIQVGDELVLSNNEKQQEKVTAIQTVYRRGALAPFTTSGTIVVNGVLASTYAWEEDHESFLPSFIKTDFQNWAQFVTSILRFHSKWIKKEEEYNTTTEIGRLSTTTTTTADQLRKLTLWFFQQSYIVQIILATILVLPSLSFMYILEKVYHHDFSNWSFFFQVLLMFYIIIKIKSKKKVGC